MRKRTVSVKSGTAVLALVASFAVLSVAVVSSGDEATATTITISYGTVDPPAILFEDMPGWNCRTMGNRLCGTINPHPTLTP